MIRLLLALIIVALLLTKVSEMFEEKETTRPPSAPEDTMIGGAYEPYTRAKQFSEDYGEALEQERKELDEQIDGG